MLPPFNQSFTVEWWADGHLVSVETTGQTSDGFVWLCEACGYDKPWAAKYFPNRALTRFYSACREHPATRGEIPGSMILWFHDEMRDMPASLIEREYNIHLAYYLKENEREQTQSGDTRSTQVPRISAAGLLAELEGGTGTPNLAGA